MSATEPDLDARANHLWLLGEFLAQLFAHRPTTLLDVGCGAGQLVKTCRERGIEAIGLDQPGPALDALRAEGVDARAGTAYELPLGDAAVEWVTMRHIPHHLEHPARAFEEALRVARVGVLVAEPHFDSSLPSQRGALAVDRWEKRLDRSGGMFHAEALDLGALLALLPVGFETEFECEARRCWKLRSRSISDFERYANERLLDLPARSEARETLAALLTDLERLGLTWSGSLCVTLRRRT